MVMTINSYDVDMFTTKTACIAALRMVELFPFGPVVSASGFSSSVFQAPLV
jgi:hypothetical protein